MTEVVKQEGNLKLIKHSEEYYTVEIDGVVKNVCYDYISGVMCFAHQEDIKNGGKEG